MYISNCVVRTNILTYINKQINKKDLFDFFKFIFIFQEKPQILKWYVYLSITTKFSVLFNGSLPSRKCILINLKFKHLDRKNNFYLSEFWMRFTQFIMFFYLSLSLKLFIIISFLNLFYIAKQNMNLFSYNLLYTIPHIH